jgi:Spy/CpxP family protein refolding chaperone
MKKNASSSSGGGKRRPKRAAPVKPVEEAGIRGDLEVAKRYNVSTRTIKSWRDAGMPHTREGRQCVYKTAETDPWVELQRRTDESLNLTPASKAKLRREEARARREEVEAARAEREEEIELGNVLGRDEWELFAIEVVQKARDQFMRLPKTLCKHVPRKFHAVLQREGENDVRKICEEMARDLAEGAAD